MSGRARGAEYSLGGRMEQGGGGGNECTCESSLGLFPRLCNTPLGLVQVGVPLPPKP